MVGNCRRGTFIETENAVKFRIKNRTIRLPTSAGSSAQKKLTIVHDRLAKMSQPRESRMIREKPFPLMKIMTLKRNNRKNIHCFLLLPCVIKDVSSWLKIYPECLAE